MTDEGRPSDEVPAVLATGRTDVTTVVASLSGRHPEGRDAEYLAWHALDHRPEQHRLAGLRGSLRVVATPACRAARAAAAAPHDAVDHAMVYLFADSSDLAPFKALGAALREAGRMPIRLPPVDLGVYRHEGALADPAVLVGADVLPWRPVPGVYLLLEEGGDAAGADDLVAVPGVAGAWWAAGTGGGALTPEDRTGRRLTLCFLEDDPLAVADRLRPVLDRRWAGGGATPLLAGPFLTVAGPHLEVTFSSE